MRGLPPPTDFNEGLRLLFSLAAISFAICCGIGLCVLVGVLIWGGWPKEFYGQILTTLGYIALGALALLGITQVGQLVGGPVGRFKGGIGKDGANFEAENTSSPAAPTVTTTTEVKP